MSRLIDADKFKHYVKEHCKDSLADLWCVLIDRQPTAFDTEKVVEQIHDKYCHKCRNIFRKQSSEEYCKSVKCEIDALCDIVKKGRGNERLRS